MRGGASGDQGEDHTLTLRTLDGRLERVAYPCVATEAVGNTLRGGRLYFDLADSRWKLERIEYPSEVCCVYAS